MNILTESEIRSAIVTANNNGLVCGKQCCPLGAVMLVRIGYEEAGFPQGWYASGRLGLEGAFCDDFTCGYDTAVNHDAAYIAAQSDAYQLGAKFAIEYPQVIS